MNPKPTIKARAVEVTLAAKIITPRLVADLTAADDAEKHHIAAFEESADGEPKGNETMTDKALLPCPVPWCVTNTEPEEYANAQPRLIEDGDGYRMRCDGCSCQTYYCGSPELAREQWNTRPTPKVKPLVWEPKGKSAFFADCPIFGRLAVEQPIGLRSWTPDLNTTNVLFGGARSSMCPTSKWAIKVVDDARSAAILSALEGYGDE